MKTVLKVTWTDSSGVQLVKKTCSFLSVNTDTGDIDFADLAIFLESIGISPAQLQKLKHFEAVFPMDRGNKFLRFRPF